MLELRGSTQRFCDRLSRRAMLRIGALAPLGLSLPALLGANARAASPLAASRDASSNHSTFGRAKRCLMLYMWGGPSHIDLYDMKPDAAAEIRGPFKPIRTTTPGYHISELLPNLAKQTHRLAFIRSVTHTDNNHSTAAHWMMTGRRHERSAENFGARRSDFPHIGSVMSRFMPVGKRLPTFVALPEVIGTTAGFVTPGQDGGILGRKYDPFRINQHPDEEDFQVRNLLPAAGVTRQRVRQRIDLVKQFDHTRRTLGEAIGVGELDAYKQQAIDLVTSPAAHEAFDLAKESKEQRDRYGMHCFGQSLLMARRLLEAGVKLVTVYWHRDKPGVDTTWDTHAKNFSQLKDRLCPQVDKPLAVLLDDLADRGMLDDTLIMWNSEFGRTPKVNGAAGRDHWGKANTVWFAGAGIHGGAVHGSTDATASEPASDPVAPHDLSATVYHLLGLDPATVIYDSLERPLPISEGTVVREVLG